MNARTTMPSERPPQAGVARARRDSTRAPATRFGVPLLFALACLWLAPRPAEAQGNHYRLGVVLGSTGFVGLNFEYRFGNTGADFTVGTIGFRDLSLSLVGKQYVGGGEFRPYAGGGLWSMLAWPEGERMGWVLILRAPVGINWNVVDATNFGVEGNLNRAIRVRRSDPRDERGPASRLVPLPGVYYKWASEQR